MSKVLTGALAIIRVNGTAIGKMRNIRATENVRRVDVRGLGTILTQEAPVVEWAGTITASFYEIDFETTGIERAIRRDVQTAEEFEDNLVLDSEDGVQIDIFKKVEDIIDPVTQLRKAKAQPYAIINRCLIESDGFDINEGVVAGHDQTFKFLDPIIYPA